MLVCSVSYASDRFAEYFFKLSAQIIQSSAPDSEVISLLALGGFQMLVAMGSSPVLSAPARWGSIFHRLDVGVHKPSARTSVDRLCI